MLADRSVFPLSQIRLSLSVALLIVLSACKAEPLKPSGFIEHPEMMTHCELIPFQKVWKDPNVKATDYDKIMVAHVFTKNDADKSWMEEANVRTWLDEEGNDVKEFAEYTEKAFRQALSKSKKYHLVDKPGPRTIVLELALVKIVPGKPVLGAAKNLATPVVGAFRLMAIAAAPAKTAVSASTDSPLQASVAIEGRIRDAMTKKVIATFADREKQESAIFNLEDFSAYGNLKQIVDEWARQFVEVLDKNPLKTGVKVKDSEPGIKIINP